MRLATLPILLGLASLGTAQERIRDVVYLKQAGTAFTLDVFKPARPNGITVVHLVSGGWVSDHSGINPMLAQGANAAGFTMVQVVHGAQPRYKVPEIVGQVQRAVRYLRANASQYGIDPARIGLTGGSAGGHLSLMIGALHADGNPNAADPVERFPARVGAIGVFFPPTDFTSYGKDRLFAFDNPLLRDGYGNAFVPDIKTASPDVLSTLAKDLSPALRFTKDTPPVLLVHGDKDLLVPIQQSELALKRLQDLGVKSKLVTVPGAGHGWPDMSPQFLQILDWFREHLKG